MVIKFSVRLDIIGQLFYKISRRFFIRKYGNEMVTEKQVGWLKVTVLWGLLHDICD